MKKRRGKFELEFDENEIVNNGDHDVYGVIRRDGLEYEAKIRIHKFADNDLFISNVELLPLYCVVCEQPGKPAVKTYYHGKDALDIAWNIVINKTCDLIKASDAINDDIRINRDEHSVYIQSTGIHYRVNKIEPNTPWTRYMKKWNLKLQSQNGEKICFGWINTFHTGIKNVPKFLTGRYFAWPDKETGSYHGFFVLDHPEVNEDNSGNYLFVHYDGYLSDMPFITGCIEDCCYFEESYIDNLGINFYE